MSNNFSLTSSLCFNNRDWILCSSSECRQHSNWILVFYAVAGPLLIYLLYALRLTLITDTLNVIILYDKEYNAGLLNLLNKAMFTVNI